MRKDKGTQVDTVRTQCPCLDCITDSGWVTVESMYSDLSFLESVACAEGLLRLVDLPRVECNP